MINQSIRRRIIFKRFFSISLSFLFVGIALALVLNKQLIYDQIAYSFYEGSAEVLALVDNSSMSPNGKFIFLASKPILDDTGNLYKKCGGVENTASVLGCYKDGNIYLFNVHDKRIASVKEVTAAHELLHAVYDRLGKRERSRLDDLILGEYEKLKLDKDFMARMEAYTNIKDDHLPDELHSIIGTEVGVINSSLEEHYSKYFFDRQKIIGFNKSYLMVFNELKDKANEVSSRINELSKSINQASENYNHDIDLLNRDINDFNRRANSGWFISQEQFQNERISLASRASAMDYTRSKINEDIALYNDLIKNYNSIATESVKLSNSLDSSLAPAPSI